MGKLEENVNHMKGRWQSGRGGMLEESGKLRGCHTSGLLREGWRGATQCVERGARAGGGLTVTGERVEKTHGMGVRPR